MTGFRFRVSGVSAAAEVASLIAKETEVSHKHHSIGCQEFGSWTRRRPIERDYAAAKDAECGKWEKEPGVCRLSNRILFVLVLVNQNFGAHEGRGRARIRR